MRQATMEAIEFTVYGNVQPMARARVFVDKHTGRVRAANPQKSTDWKNVIRMQALEHRPSELLDCPLKLTATFHLLRPNSKKKAVYPAVKPDIDNFYKALTDALEGLMYTNDSRIVEAVIAKVYGPVPKVVIRLEGLDKIA